MTDPTHSERAHSALGASAAHRWLACPGSVAAQRGRPNATNEHSARGTCAHEVADICLVNGWDAARFIGDVRTIKGVDASGAPIEFAFEVDEKMAEDVQIYLDRCRADVEVGDDYGTEHRFDLSHLHPGMFGTNDWWAYQRKARRLIVRDYKNGFGMVDVDGNKQLQFYAIGALRLVTSRGYQVDSITVGVVQPNAPHVNGPSREWTFDVVDLIDFEMELIAGAKATQDPNAPRVAGDHCEYCLAADDCPALTAVQNMLAAAEFEPLPDMRVDKLTQLLDAATMMEARIGAAWALATRLAEEGVEIPGYKLVERKTRRKWDGEKPDEVLVKVAERFDIPIEDLYNKKPKTPAQAEKLIKAPRGEKEKFVAEFNRQFVIRPSGGRTLARTVDPRQALPVADPAADFDVIDVTPKAMLF